MRGAVQGVTEGALRGSAVQLRVALRGLEGLMRPRLSERWAWDRSADSAWCQGCSKHARAREDDTRHRHTDTTTHTDRDRDRHRETQRDTGTDIDTDTDTEGHRHTQTHGRPGGFRDQPRIQVTSDLGWHKGTVYECMFVPSLRLAAHAETTTENLMCNWRPYLMSSRACPIQMAERACPLSHGYDPSGR